MSIKNRITALIGTPTTTDAQITQFIQDGIADVVTKTLVKDPSKANLFSKTTTVQSGNGVAIAGPLIVNWATYNGKNASEIPLSLKSESVANSGSIHERSATDPCYYIENGTVYLIPVPDTNVSGKVNTIAYDGTADQDSTSIANMPQDREDLVVIYASMQCLMNSLSAIAVPSDMSATTVPTAPNNPSFTAVSLTYGQDGIIATSGLNVDWDNMLNGLTTPTYSTPVVFPDFGSANTYLAADDIELVQSRLGVINSQVAEYQANIQNQLNKFNKEMATYQNEVSARMSLYTSLLQDASSKSGFEVSKEQLKFQRELQDYTLLLQKYQSQITSYQAEVGTKVQDNADKLQRKSTDYQWITARYQTLKQQYMESI